MSFSSYNPNERYRRRAAGQLGGFIVARCVLALAVTVGFWIGYERAGQSEGSLREKLEERQALNTALENEMVEIRSEAQTAMMRYEQLQQDYQEKVPDEAVEELLALVRSQIEEGRDPERLAFLIRSARPPRNCSEIETKRFVVSTAVNQGPDSQITLADGAIVIKGSGVSARNDAGKPEAWYDPSQRVSLEFITLGGKAETKKGVFPIHHSVVSGDREYRFTVSEGARSFAKVTFDSCDYP